MGEFFMAKNYIHSEIIYIFLRNYNAIVSTSISNPFHLKSLLVNNNFNKKVMA